MPAFPSSTPQYASAQVGTSLPDARAWLAQDQVVAIPTETVYGLAGNAFRVEAVARIFEAKNRPTFDPLIVHTHHWAGVEGFTQDIPAAARQLADAFWPGPLTLLLTRNDRIPDLVTAGLDTVAVRIPRHPLTSQLLATLDFPLAAPSANPFGYVSPTTAEHVRLQLGARIPYILDGGPCAVGIESTIVGFPDGRPTVYRLGGVAVEEVERVIGPVDVRTHSVANPRAPGLLQSHYAPRKPLWLGDWAAVAGQFAPDQWGVLAFQRPLPGVPEANQVVLSAGGDLAEAARHLFAGLRSLDAAPVTALYAELLPERGLGRAINDRLRRAAAH